MKHAYVLILIFALVVVRPCFSETARYPSLEYPIPPQSVSDATGADGFAFNPASLKTNSELEVSYYHSFNDSTFDGDNGFATARLGAGFSYHKLRLDGKAEINSWTLGAGSKYGRRILIGASYTFFKTDREGYHNDHFWKAGLLYRPSRKLSIAAVADNINRMEFDGRKTRREFTIGVGIRPARERITLAADYRFFEDERFDHGALTGYGSIVVKNGIVLRGHIDEYWAFGVGLCISFGKSTSTGYARFDDSGDFSSGILSHSFSHSSRGHAIGRRARHVELKLSGAYPEEKLESRLWKKSSRTFGDLVLGLDRLTADPTVTGVSLYIDSPRLGFAQLEEMRSSLVKLRRQGKLVTAYLAPFTGTGAYFLASAADRIAIQELDVLNITGLMAEVTFYKGTLDKLGIEAQMEAIGEYKSAPELLTRDSISVYHREAIDDLLDDIWETLIDDISESRQIPEADIRALIDRAPLTSREAFSAGLIDTILHPDEFDKWTDALQEGSRLSFDEYLSRRDYSTQWDSPDRIAVIPVEGEIIHGHSSNRLYFGKTLGSVTLAKVISRARGDDDVKAIVLRVNSPGGESFGSEAIRRELELTRETKPVVVSMGNIAASGGYHVSSASDYILAQATTLTGSIGVFYGKLDLSGLREKIGLSTFHLKRGANADLYTWNKGYSEDQRTRMRNLIEFVYDDFISKVAENRNMTTDEVDLVARGRVWSGKRATEHNLVDRVGGLSDAVNEACRRAGIDRDEATVEIVPTRKQSLIPEFPDLAFASNLIGFVVGSKSQDNPADLDIPLTGGWLYRSPYDIVIR
jgi:protease-4